MKLVKNLTAVLIAIFAVGSLAACSEPEPVDLSRYAMVIDVRTDAEWNDGHLEGAELIGIADSDFVDRLGQLDKEENYYIYCRSGNRAGQAIEIMRKNGFTGELENGGSLGNASAETGLAVVQ